MSPMECRRREDVAPVCPHCDEELSELFVRKPKGPFGIGQGFVFLCPKCHRILGCGVEWYPFPSR